MRLLKFQNDYHGLYRLHNDDLIQWQLNGGKKKIQTHTYMNDYKHKIYFNHCCSCNQEDIGRTQGEVLWDIQAMHHLDKQRKEGSQGSLLSLTFSFFCLKFVETYPSAFHTSCLSHAILFFFLVVFVCLVLFFVTVYYKYIYIYTTIKIYILL